MSILNVMASNVGAGVGLVRSVQGSQLKEQKGTSEDVGVAALRLINQALQVTGTAQHDLDVLA